MLNSKINNSNKSQNHYKKRLNKKRRLYKFHKYRKMKFRKRLINILLLSIIIITLIVTIKALYIRYKCKDIYYSIDYYMTSSYFEDNKLLRVKEMNLIYSDDKNVIAIASGLDHESPHKYSSYKISLSRTEKDYWKMQSITPINN